MKEKQIVLSFHIISLEYIIIILAFYNYFILSRAFVYTPSYVRLEKTLSQALEILQQVYKDNTMSRTRIL